MNNRNPGLFGQDGQISTDAVFRLADIDDDVRGGGQQRFQIHLAFATVQLANLCFAENLLGQIEGRISREFVANTNQHVTG